MAKLQVKTEEQKKFIENFENVACSILNVNEDTVEIDGCISYDEMSEIVDYLHGVQDKEMVRTIKVSTEIDYPPNYDWQHKTKDEIISDNPKMIETKSMTYTWDCPINLHIETMTNATKDDIENFIVNIFNQTQKCNNELRVTGLTIHK